MAARLEGIVVKPQIMIPLVFSDHEVSAVTAIIRRAYASECGQAAHCVPYSIGCMLETPRGCLRAWDIAKEKGVDFVSFGTNDLTQLVFGISRDDAHRFLVRNIFTFYLNHVIFCKYFPVYFTM